MNDRDTKFLGFAKLLWDDIMASQPESAITEMFYLGDDEKAVHIIARRAYDLVEHTIDAMKPYIYDDLTAGFESVDDVPDLTEWPTE